MQSSSPYQHQHQHQRPSSPDDVGDRLAHLEQEAADLRAQLASLVALVRAAWAGSQEATDQLADVVNWPGDDDGGGQRPVTDDDADAEATNGGGGEDSSAATAAPLTPGQQEALRRRVAQLEELLSQEELRAAWDTQRRRVSFRPASGVAASQRSRQFGGDAGGIRVRDLVLPASGPGPVKASSQQQQPHAGDLFDPQSLRARAGARVQSACPPTRPVATPPGQERQQQQQQRRPRTGGSAEWRRRQQPQPQQPPSGPQGVSVVGERPLKFERMEGGGGGGSVRQHQQRLTSVRLNPPASAGRRRQHQRQPQPPEDRLSADVAAAEQRGGQLESEFDRVMVDLQRKLGLDSHGLV